ncbi:hypothetical protein TNCV_4346611 [Trichonephila clavipes]|nr:hypothetical protein TNCV_4346611 [Trichonephila clavipes]
MWDGANPNTPIVLVNRNFQIKLRLVGPQNVLWAFILKLISRKIRNAKDCWLSRTCNQQSKNFMQQLWLLKLEWYEKLPVPVAADDASKKGFGAIAYVSVIKNNGDHHSKNLCSKSRVAPLKVLTIPILELLACFLLSKLSSHAPQGGAPQFEKHCDNGETFVWANIKLKKLHGLVKAPDETLVSYFNDEYIDWNFIPPRSLNFGGL